MQRRAQGGQVREVAGDYVGPEPAEGSSFSRVRANARTGTPAASSRVTAPPAAADAA